MAQWVKLCSVADAPGEGKVMEAEAGGVEICLARLNGELCAIDNWCPHKRGPLGQGWMEGTAVVCPWHSWAFDMHTGIATYPEKEYVTAFELKTEGDDVLVDLS